jgi:hypothetical protein
VADLQFNITAVFEQASVAFRQLADDLDTVKKKVDELNATKGEVQVGDRGADETKAKMAEVRAEVEALDTAKATPEVDPKGIDETKAKVEEVKADFDTLGAKKAEPEVTPKGLEPAKLSLDQIFDRMDRLKADKAEPEVAPKGVEESKISLDDVKARIEALKNERADPEITIKTGKAEEQLGAFANKMRLDIQAAIKSLPEVNLTMKLDATEFETHIQEIRAELAAMQNLVVKGTFDDAEFLIKLHELEAELKVLGAEDLTVRAKFDVATAMAALTAFRTEVEKRTELTVDTTKASSEIGAFAATMTARLDAAIKALPAIDFHADSSEADTKIAELRAQLESLRDVTVTGHFDDAEMLARISELEASLKALSNEAVTVQAKFDYASAAAEIAAFRAAVEKKLEVNVGTDQAEASIGKFATDVRTKIEAAIKALPDVKITGDSSDVDQKIAAVRSLLESLKDKRIGIDIDRARFDASMAVINAELAALSGKKIDIPVRVDADAARTALKGIGTDLDDAKAKTNSFSSAIDSFAGVMSTKMGLIGGSITPVLASIGQLSGALGLLPAVATAVGTGFAAVKVGTEGVSQAVQSFSGIEDLATKAADANAKAQQAQATASQATAAAGGQSVAALKEQVAQGGVNVANLQAQAAAQGSSASATSQATTAQAALVAQYKAAQAAGSPYAAQLKQQVLDGAANVAQIKAQTAAHGGNTSALTAARTQQSSLNAALKEAELNYKGSTAAGTSAAEATKNAQQATSAANSAQSQYNSALEAYKVALGNLAPSAQAFVTQLASMNSTFKDLKIDVQQHLFAGLASALQSLATSALPTVRTGLVQMADAINTAVKNVTTFITQQSSVTAWKEIFSNVATAATNLAGAIKPILQIITDVTQVGSSMLPGLATSFANAAQAAADFVSKAKETGQLAQWIQAGLTAVGQLWDAFKNVVAIVKDLATAPGFAPSFLQSLDAVTAGIRWITDNIPLATTAVNLFFAAWVFAKITSGIIGLVTSISGIGNSIDALVAKLAVLTGGEEAAGVAATGMVAGFTGMLGPLAALGVAVGVLVTQWDVVKAGFQQIGIIALAAANDIVGAAKAIGDAATLNFGAAQRALDDTNAKHKELMTEFSNLNGFNSATAGATGLTGALGGTTTALGTQAGAATSTATAYDSLKQALTGVTTSVTANGTAVNANTTAGQANVAAVQAAISAAQSEEQAYAASGASISQQTALHNSNLLAIQKVTTGLGINSGSVAALISTYAAGNPRLKLTPTLDPSGVVTGAKTAQAAADGLHAPPPLQFKGDASDVTAKAGQAKTAASGVPQPPTSQFKGDASGVTASAGQAKTATSSVPSTHDTSFFGHIEQLIGDVNNAISSIGSVVTSHNTTFIGAIDDINNKANSVTTLIAGVVQKWLTSFFGDTTNLGAAAPAATGLIGSVPSTHGSAFTGDPSGLNAAVATAVAGIATVNPAPPPVVFTGDITDITTKTTEATTQITAVPLTHVTTLTADDTDLLAKDTAAIASINSIPLTHNTTITATDNATAVINSIVNSLNTLQDKTITITTVYRTVNAAGGLIATAGMANGGLMMPMANGGDLSPNMSASSAKVIPPNTWRVIGDRMTDDEAFIPINNSSSSAAILAETANRMGQKVMPMAGGGYNHRGDDNAWDWLWRHHHHGGGGGTPPPTTPPPIPENWGGSAAYDVALRQGYATNIGSLGSGATEAVTRPVTGYARTGTYLPETPSVAANSGSSSPPVVTVKFDNPSGNSVIDALFNEFRKSIRVQGGNVQFALGSR